MASTTADQLELIQDDPRKEVSSLGPRAMIRALREAREEHGELISFPAACKILDVTRGHLGSLVLRGHLTRIEIGPMKLLSGNEIEALYDLRRAGEIHPGKKMVPMSEFLKAQHDMK